MSTTEQNILGALPVAVVHADANERITYANQLAVSILGCRRPEEAIGAPLDRFLMLPSPLRDLAEQANHRATSCDVSRRGTLGELVPLVLRVEAVSAEAPSGFACVIHAANDVTGPADTAGRSHFERLIAMGQMVAGFAHEVRNPLAALKSLIEDLAAETPADDPKSDDLARVVRLVKRIEALVRNALLFGKPSLPLQGPHEPASIVAAALDTLDPPHRGNEAVRIRTIIEPSVPQVFVDDEQIVQVLIVLLNNAVEAVGQSTEVTVRVQRGGSGDTDVPANEGTVLIEVEDRGPGIPAEIRSQIFDPFFTTKPRGTGLGLSIARRLVQENRGQIRLRSSAETGTVFTIELPVYRP